MFQREKFNKFTTSPPAFLPAFLLLLSIPLFAEDIELTDVRLTNSAGQVLLTLGDTRGQALMSGEMPLEEGDSIATGADGSAEISFNEGTLIRLAPHSALHLKRLTAKKTVLYLRQGVLLARVAIDIDRGQQFFVLTPAAVATVKGTEFVVDQQGNRALIGVLNEGHVSVQSPGFRKQVLMRFNQEAVIQKGAPPRDLKVLTRLYPYKTQMAEMRTRIKQLRRHETALAPQQRAMLRAGWKNTHGVPKKRKLLRLPIKRSKNPPPKQH